MLQLAVVSEELPMAFLMTYNSKGIFGDILEFKTMAICDDVMLLTCYVIS